MLQAVQCSTTRNLCQSTPHAARKYVQLGFVSRQQYHRYVIASAGRQPHNMQSIKQQLEGFFFDSPFSNWLWKTSVSHSWRVIRLAGMLLISIILTARSYRLYVRYTPAHAAVAALLALGCLFWDAGKSCGVAAAAWLLRTAVLLAQQPEENAGHRVGGKGFDSRLCENSLEALADLIHRDLNGSMKPGELAYVEYDVHETKDGELVVLHDLQRVLNASRHASINSGVIAALEREVGGPAALQRAHVQDVQWSSLQKLHLGGQADVHIPTLEAILQCCIDLHLRHSMAVEVKSIITDDGRRRFLQLVRRYKERHCMVLEGECPDAAYAPFGFVAVISFPFHWAASFGEFGSQEWLAWGVRFWEAGIPVRSCVAHFIDLIAGAQA